MNIEIEASNARDRCGPIATAVAGRSRVDPRSMIVESAGGDNPDRSPGPQSRRSRLGATAEVPFHRRAIGRRAKPAAAPLILLTVAT